MAAPVSLIEQRQIIALHRDGLPVAEIAHAVGRGAQTVRDHLTHTRQIPPPRPVSLTGDQIAAIAAGYRRGLSIRACAQNHGTTWGVARRALLYAGIPLRSQGGHQRTRTTPAEPPAPHHPPS